MMPVLVVGCSHHNTPVEIRERLAFTHEQIGKALEHIKQRWGCEAAILSTCNRVELYLASAEGECKVVGAPEPDAVAELFSHTHDLAASEVRRHLYYHHGANGARHLFRVAASLDSMIVGEGQIAGQVKEAYELAREHGAAGPVLHSLFQQAHRAAKRVRTETGISRGNVNVASVAVAYVREVFHRFHDKTVLVIGAGKIGELTLKHLQRLKPQQILVVNRSPEKANAVASGCGGLAVAWDRLDDVLSQADIILSTTGAPEPIVTLDRFGKALARRARALPTVILDIAVPRDFDPRIHDGDRTFLFNIDDLQRVRLESTNERFKYMAAADAIIEQELQRFLCDWERKRHGPIIAKLTREYEAKQREVVVQLLDRLNGKLDADDRVQIEGAFRLLQNKFLHSPIAALADEVSSDERHTLLEALERLFGLNEK